MADHWKSTPSYWCKFCSQYVRDTPIERKNHESTGRHQGNIQRSLRELHKNKAREDRDKQRAKDEVARLNALVSGEKGKGSSGGEASKDVATAPPPAVRSAAADRKARAEQLLAMGVKLPEELEREVTGVGGWQTVSERVVRQNEDTSLAGIMKKEEEDSKEGVFSKGVHKRKADDEEDGEGALDSGKKRKVWGSSLKTYPGADEEAKEDGENLDALLSGVGAKKKVKEEDGGGAGEPNKQEEGDANGEVKDEAEEQKALSDVPPPVIFKKRKMKK